MNARASAKSASARHPPLSRESRKPGKPNLSINIRLLLCRLFRLYAGTAYIQIKILGQFRKITTDRRSLRLCVTIALQRDLEYRNTIAINAPKTNTKITV